LPRPNQAPFAPVRRRTGVDALDFLSYAAVTRHDTGRLYDRLIERFGPVKVL
jgi:hypothetical protein